MRKRLLQQKWTKKGVDQIVILYQINPKTETILALKSLNYHTNRCCSITIEHITMNVASACICIPIWQFVGILAITFLVASKSHSLNLTKQKRQCPKLVLFLARRFLAFLACQLMLLVALQSLVWLLKQSLVLYCTRPPGTETGVESGPWGDSCLTLAPPS